MSEIFKSVQVIDVENDKNQQIYSSYNHFLVILLIAQVYSPWLLGSPSLWTTQWYQTQPEMFQQSTKIWELIHSWRACCGSKTEIAEHLSWKTGCCQNGCHCSHDSFQVAWTLQKWLHRLTEFLPEDTEPGMNDFLHFMQRNSLPETYDWLPEGHWQVDQQSQAPVDTFPCPPNRIWREMSGKQQHEVCTNSNPQVQSRLSLKIC